ncbi:adenosylcobinamide amidohydrolase [Rummeliibacillus sp. JY-2-4R]
MLTIKQLSGGYDPKKPIVKDVTFTIEKGKFVGILGPNGSGKSTLIKVISGILKASAGSIKINDKNLEDYSSKELARTMAVLPQLNAQSFSHTVRETVSIGRYPHQNSWFSTWSDEDEVAVTTAMKQTGIIQYENQQIEFLSGGEQQRTFVAQALAQRANLLLLDEPTNHLDIEHQRKLMDMIRYEVVHNGLTVVSIFHDMNLASIYCDQLILLEDGQIHSMGEPHEVLKEQHVLDVYQTKVSRYPHPIYPKPQITLIPELQENAQKINTITAEQIQIRDEYVELQTTFPLKTVSSAVHNAGFGWFQTFINRTVEITYMIDNAHEELEDYLERHGFSPTNTVAMMTAVAAKHVVVREYSSSVGSIVVAVTAGVGNAVDVSKAYERQELPHIGTINTWVFVNGTLTDEAFMQAMITATEAKTKALTVENIKDDISNTIATGTSTDSVLVAATQKEPFFEYAGTVTGIGKLIGRGVFETTRKALQDYKRAKGMA